MEIASAYVSLLPSAKGFGSKLNGSIGGDIEKAGRQGGARYGKVFASATMSPIRAIGVAALGLFAVDKVKNFLGASIGEAREAQKVSALTGQVIKTTGGAANISATQVGNLANAISKKVGIDDEAIQSGENLLLTFRNVRNEVGKGNKIFNQATRLAVDMSTALGTDARSAAMQLGKALNDPAKGVSRLARSGIQFTKHQTKQIKAMQKSGNLLGAQKIILGEVAKEFGGAAAAQATSGEKMSVAFKNLQEQIGTALLPVLDRVQGVITGKIIPAISTFVAQMQSGTGAGGAFVANLRTFAGVLGTVFGFISANRDAVATFVGVIFGVASAIKVWTIAQAALNVVLTANPIGIVVVALAGLAAGLVYAYKRSETFRNIVNAAFSVVRGVVTAVANFVSKYVPRAFSILVSGVRAYISVYRSVVVGAFNAVRAIVGSVGAFVAGAVKFFATFAKGVKTKTTEAVNFVKSLPGKFVSALSDAGHLLYTSGTKIIQGLIDGIKAKGGEVAGAVKGVLQKARNLLPFSPAKEGPFSGKGWTLHSGISLMQGLADGISRSKGKVQSAIRQVLDAVKQAVQQTTSSVAQAFGGDLFSATSGAKFLQNLNKTNGTVTQLKTAFARLLKWGWKPEALSALFQSGNSGLILSLASSQALATQAARQYQSVQSNLNSLGSQVANAQYSLAQDRTLRKFDDLIKAVRSVGIDVSVELNSTAKKAHRRKRNK